MRRRQHAVLGDRFLGDRRHTDRRQPRHYPRPDPCRILADAAGEDDRVQGGQRGDRGGDAFGRPGDEDPQGEASPAIAVGLRLEQLAHVGGSAGDAHQPRLMLHLLGQLLGSEATGLQQIKQDPRVDRAGSRAHHQALERGHAHGRGDGTTAVDGGHGATAAQVGHHDSQLSDGSGEECRGPFGRPCHRHAVEAVTAYAPIAVPGLGNGVPECRIRKRGVEGGVEDRHMPQVRERRQSRGHGRGRDAVVERGKVGQRGDLLDHLGSHQYGSPKRCSAVDNAVADGAECRWINARRLVPRYERADVVPWVATRRGIHTPVQVDMPERSQALRRGGRNAAFRVGRRNRRGFDHARLERAGAGVQDEYAHRS